MCLFFAKLWKLLAYIFLKTFLPSSHSHLLLALQLDIDFLILFQSFTEALLINFNLFFFLRPSDWISVD